MENQAKLGMKNAQDGLDLPQEVRRIREVFAQRKQVRVSEWIPHFNLYMRYVLYERSGVLIGALRKINVKTLRGMKTLDVGCGGGTLLRYLYDFGAKPKDCFGIDVLEDALQGAKELAPNAGFSLASAARLPFADETFDRVSEPCIYIGSQSRHQAHDSRRNTSRAAKGWPVYLVRLHI